ncbi:unnamed protein product, partial [Mesorhabditis spiculigera]
MRAILNCFLFSVMLGTVVSVLFCKMDSDCGRWEDYCHSGQCTAKVVRWPGEKCEKAPWEICDKSICCFATKNTRQKHCTEKKRCHHIP